MVRLGAGARRGNLFAKSIGDFIPPLQMETQRLALQEKQSLLAKQVENTNLFWFEQKSFSPPSHYTVFLFHHNTKKTKEDTGPGTASSQRDARRGFCLPAGLIASGI